MLEDELAVAEEAARRAGAIVARFYGDSYEVRSKGHDNPVTEADLRSNECIRNIIGQTFPADGWLSEETRDSRDRLKRRRVWIVDPMDGTKEFIQHIPELCVCIALVEDRTPILGVSFNPIRNQMFVAARGLGMRLNGAPARVSDVDDLKRARVLASRSEDARGEWEAFRSRLKVILTGSVAYKLALIAAGLGDATFSLTPKHEWDVCAGAALIREAGGRITDCYGQELRFNQPDPLLPGIIATNPSLFEPVSALIAATR